MGRVASDSQDAPPAGMTPVFSPVGASSSPADTTDTGRGGASPMDWKQPDYRAVYERRAGLLNAIRTSREMQEAALKVYAVDPVRWIEDWGMTFDPRRVAAGGEAWMPFVLWPRQREFIRWLEGRVRGRRGGLVEKCRDAGVTWLCTAFALWMWRFVPGAKVGFGSRKEILVDRLGDVDSIFERLRLLLLYLPVELSPAGFKFKEHALYMKLVNPQNGNIITGEAGDNIGRGGRTTLYFVDEAAFLERPQAVDASLSANTNIRIDISTPNGENNPFHRARRKAKGDDLFIFDWRQDPRKDAAWYTEQAERLDPVTLAQEIDRDYGASVERAVMPRAWLTACVRPAQVRATGSRRAGLDVSDGGRDSNALVDAHGSVVGDVEVWNKGTTTETARLAAARCREKGIRELRYDCIGVGAGVRGELNEKEYRDLTVNAINSASAPTPGWHVPGVKLNEEMFLNLRAQMWWEMRRRVYLTWSVVTGRRPFANSDELVSLPADEELLTEMASPQYQITRTGKLQIESKDDMRRRGVESPNRADALMLAFAPVEEALNGSW